MNILPRTVEKRCCCLSERSTIWNWRISRLTNLSLRANGNAQRVLRNISCLLTTTSGKVARSWFLRALARICKFIFCYFELSVVTEAERRSSGLARTENLWFGLSVCREAIKNHISRMPLSTRLKIFECFSDNNRKNRIVRDGNRPANFKKEVSNFSPQMWNMFCAAIFSASTSAAAVPSYEIC